MDHPTHGIEATVIDLGLARMDAVHEDGELDVRWTPFDEEIFEGEGQCFLIRICVLVNVQKIDGLLFLQAIINSTSIATCGTITVATGRLSNL